MPSHPRWFEYTSKGQNGPSEEDFGPLDEEEIDRVFEMFRELQALEWELALELTEAER